MAVDMTPEELARHLQVLDRSSDREQVAASAVALAASGDNTALLELAKRLGKADFLNRLDDTQDPSTDITNLSGVFGALTSNPSAASARMCELVYPEPDFQEVPVRINLLLGALAAVKPLSPEGAEIFRDASAQGFAEVAGPLLINNESLPALRVFEEIIAGGWVESYVKVDILHRSVLPKRTDLPVLRSCERMLAAPPDDQVREGIVETLFDYRSREWFGPALQPPAPPPWESASTEALRFLIELARKVESLPVSERLHTVVRAERARIEMILAARAQ